MKGLLVHGCFDQTTLNTLLELGVRSFGLDLRPRSVHFVPYNELFQLLSLIPPSEVVLVFENDSLATIFSFLDLCKDFPHHFIVEFRDALAPSVYTSFQHPFYWMWSPHLDDREILSSPYLQGVLLPSRWTSHYRHSSFPWEIIEARELAVFVHAENSAEASGLVRDVDLNISVDLDETLQESYRVVNQRRLKEQRIWRKVHEVTTFK